MCCILEKLSFLTTDHRETLFTIFFIVHLSWRISCCRPVRLRREKAVNSPCATPHTSTALQAYISTADNKKPAGRTGGEFLQSITITNYLKNEIALSESFLTNDFHDIEVSVTLIRIDDGIATDPLIGNLSSADILVFLFEREILIPKPS